MHGTSQLIFSNLYCSESPDKESVLPLVHIGLLISVETIKVIFHRHAQKLILQVILAAIKLTFNTNYDISYCKCVRAYYCPYHHTYLA